MVVFGVGVATSPITSLGAGPANDGVSSVHLSTSVTNCFTETSAILSNAAGDVAVSTRAVRSEGSSKEEAHNKQRDEVVFYSKLKKVLLFLSF